MVCQVYLTKPLLIDGYKFDMRIYVLVTACDPFRIYMFDGSSVRVRHSPVCVCVSYADSSPDMLL